MHLIRKSICLLRGHSPTQVPAAFCRSWNGIQEIGSLHCKRCGKMLGEYRRAVAADVGAGIGSGGIRWFQSSEQVPEGWPWGGCQICPKCKKDCGSLAGFRQHWKKCKETK
jgi:hypothetical protein